MRVFLAVVCLAVAAQAASLYQDEWQAFKAKHNKEYESPEEDSFRFKIFVENSRRVEEHNRRYEQGLSTFTMKMNKFGDMMNQEFIQKMGGYRPDLKTPSPIVHRAATNGDLPESLDWRDEGIVTPVGNQLQCGSCWAFTATGSLEGIYALKTGKLVDLSEQQLMDCSADYGNYGCNGGWMDASYTYIKENGGIDTDEYYPYVAKTQSSCMYSKQHVGATDTGFVDIEEGNEDALQDAVVNVGPVGMAVDASHSSFQMYSSGVYDEPDCTTVVDHSAVVVGYGVEDGADYWLVKNSWGTEWGDEGYIKMSRNKNNQCGIASQASYPTV